MKITTIVPVIALSAMLTGSALAQTKGDAPGNTASPSKEADKMRSGATEGSVPNSSNPGANPAADGNATQDSRTTTTRNR